MVRASLTITSSINFKASNQPDVGRLVFSEMLMGLTLSLCQLSLNQSDWSQNGLKLEGETDYHFRNGFLLAS